MKPYGSSRIKWRDAEKPGLNPLVAYILAFRLRVSWKSHLISSREHARGALCQLRQPIILTELKGQGMYWFAHVKCTCFAVTSPRTKHELFYNVSLTTIFKVCFKVVFICFAETIKGKPDRRLLWPIDEKYTAHKFLSTIVLLNRPGRVTTGSASLSRKSNDCVRETDFWQLFHWHLNLCQIFPALVTA